MKKYCQNDTDSEPLDPTSGLNKYYLCECGKKYNTKGYLTRHVIVCDGNSILTARTCQTCKQNFKSYENLARHANKAHGDKSYKLQLATVQKCSVCETVVNSERKLWSHIRRYHFNLNAKVPPCENFKVNQVWFEKEQNSDAVIEIRKTDVNTLVLKKMPSGTTVPVTDVQSINLEKLYPCGNSHIRIRCKYCNKRMLEHHIKKHTLKKHSDLINFNIDTTT